LALLARLKQGNIVRYMPRRLYNWSYKDVTDFLREKGFSFYKELKGSHETWIKRGSNGDEDIVVEVNFTHRPYPPHTLKLFIYQSGLDKEEWLKWGGS
jgi:hypothetical protein